MTEAIIEADGVVKRFGKVEALAGLELVACSGQVTAVLGPNGAGKTTFERTVAALVRPDAGTLRVAGIDVGRRPQQVRQAIGLAGQYAAVEPAMTGPYGFPGGLPRCPFGRAPGCLGSVCWPLSR